MIINFRRNLYILAVFSALFFQGCGGGGAAPINNAPTQQQIAIDKIMNYATSGGTLPTIEDYQSAGVTGVTGDNINKINEEVSKLNREDVDTKEEIQAIADRLNIQLPSNTIPIITLKGPKTQTINVESSYTELGATAYDSDDGDISGNIIIDSSAVNINVVGSYTVTYRVSDADGNEVSVTRNVVVKLPETADAILINGREHISLTAGVQQKLYFADNKEVTWSSNNPAVTIDQSGNLFAPEDKMGAQSQAVITATPTDGSAAATCNVTIVNWRANLSTLSVEANPPSVSALLTKDGSTLYFSAGSTLYTSTDGMATRQNVGSFPLAAEQTPILIQTPYSQYLRVDNKIFQSNGSNDFINYSEILTSEPSGLPHATEHGGLQHAFAYAPNGAGGYIYAGEYSMPNTNTHNVYRGTISATGAITDWKKVLEFDSESSNTTDSALHIHTVTVDPYTNNVWVGTGDEDRHSKLYYSETGEPGSFKLFAIGAQHFRILSMWFTKDYIYWNTDSDYVKQVVSRVKRTDHDTRELTPRLATGQTKPGVKYYVFASNGTLPTAGSIYTETTPRTLSNDNIVYAIDDPVYDYREVVAELANGSHWYHMWVEDDKGEDLVIMSTAPEGTQRDDRARIFGIKEKSDGTVDVQELFSYGTASTSHMQFEPGFQDDDGYIYFKGRATEYSVYKTRLHWKDQ